MALIEVKVPQLSESVSEATLLIWHKKIGEAVKRDENLIDIETDKVVLELPAPANGVILQHLKTQGNTAVADEVIAIIDTEALPKLTQEEPQTTSKSQKKNTLPAPGIAMPAAEKIISENKLSIDQIDGTGKNGRITKADVIKNLQKTKPQTVSPPNKVSSDNRPEDRVPMSRLRARIAERLLQSQSSNAILTTFNEVNMQSIIDLRIKYKSKFEKEHDVKLGFMSFFVKAAVAALKKYPILNASVDNNDIIYHGYFDLGVAVGTARGLVVPILRDVDQMSISDIEKKIKELSIKAKDNKLTMDDLTGGTFSISNGGTFGSMLSTPIINPPQSAILGIHATKDRAVVENGQIVIRPINYLALSYDHRIIDGREAVLGLVAIKEVLEDPTLLLLNL